MKRFIYLSILCTPLLVQAQQAAQGSPSVNGIARVVNGAQSWYIDSTGNKAFDQLTALSATHGGKQLAVKNDRQGIVHAAGHWLLPPEYDEVDTRWPDVWKIKKNGKTGWADSSGRILLAPRFEDAGYLDGRYFDVKQNGKWGIYDIENQQMLIPFAYDGFDYCGGCGRKPAYVYAKKNGKWGVIDFSQRVLAPFLYDHAHSRMRSDNWVTAFSRNGKPVALNLANGKEYTGGEVVGYGLLAYRGRNGLGLVNARGVDVLPAEYEDIRSPDNDFAPPSGYLAIQKSGRWGLVDTAGRICMAPHYDDNITTVFDSLFTAGQNGLHVLFNATGQHLLPEGVTDLQVMRDAAAVAYRRNGKYGVYHVRTGRLTPAVYDDVSEEYYGSAWLQSCVIVVKDGWSGLLGPDGKEVVPPRFDGEFSEVGEGTIAVRKGRAFGLYNAAGHELAPPEYDRFARELGDTSLITMVRETGDASFIGIMDGNGGVVVPPVYDDLLAAGDSLVLLHKDGRRTALNTYTRDTFSLPAAEDVRVVAPHMLALKKAEGYTLYNLRTRREVTPLYDYLGSFGSGAALATAGGKTGMIDAAGKIVLPLAYDAGSEVTPGIALITRGGRYGFADSTGKVIVPVEYDYHPDAYGQGYRRGDYLLLERRRESGESLVGLAAPDGRIVLPPVYGAIFVEETGKGFLVMQNRQFGLLQRDGTPVVPIMYDDIVPSSIDRFRATFTFSWPLLCRKGNSYQYVGSQGRPLPLQVEAVTGFGEAGW